MEGIGELFFENREDSWFLVRIWYMYLRLVRVRMGFRFIKEKIINFEIYRLGEIVIKIKNSKMVVYKNVISVLNIFLGFSGIRFVVLYIYFSNVFRL